TTSTPSTRPATCSSGRTSSSSSRRPWTTSSTWPTRWRPSSSSMPDLALVSVIAIVLLALVFDFTNGFHDAANSIATVVSTRVLTPRMAVVWAAFFNFVAFFVFHTKVANTVGKTVDPAVVSEAVVFAGLVGAIAWNLFTWWLGLPTSSSHAIIGGLAGAGGAEAGVVVLNAASLQKTILFIAL